MAAQKLVRKNKQVDSLLKEFIKVRKTTLELFKPLKTEDAVIQSDVFGSPPNWHLAHVTWFFQKVLEKHGKEIKVSENVNLKYLNSYYQQYGKILPKSERGRFPRPTVKQTIAYRLMIERSVVSTLRNSSSDELSAELLYDIMLGNQHEMQHQELMIYDFQHYFQRFPDPLDNYYPLKKKSIVSNFEKPSGMVEIPGGLYELGYSGHSFCYDNELPEHKVYLQPFKIDLAPVTNGDYLKFIEEGGYEEFKYWLADGWETVKDQGWKAPLYWVYNEDGKWMKKDFRGLKEIDPDEPVVNVSYYEADAYAKWAGKRLSTEAEWEKAATWNENLGRKTLYPWGDQKPTSRQANLLESYLWGPSKVGSYPDGKSYYGCHQMIGDVWEWTSSEYTLFPGFKAKFPEYTDKWTINQKVLRGGCFATPAAQIRNSYRNYFKPHERILFSGFRCAKDL